jgi:hypothetical protein
MLPGRGLRLVPRLAPVLALPGTTGRRPEAGRALGEILNLALVDIRALLANRSGCGTTPPFAVDWSRGCWSRGWVMAGLGDGLTGAGGLVCGELRGLLAGVEG